MIEGLLHELAVVARSPKSNAHMHASTSPHWGPTTPHSTALKKHCWDEATAAPFCVIVVQQIGATVGIGGGPVSYTHLTLPTTVSV